MTSDSSRVTSRCERIFLGWDAPLLPLASRVLLERGAAGARADLGQWICALPTTQAVFRFQKLLQEQSSRDQLQLTLPTVITAGELPERLYLPERPHAIEFEQTLAWSRVLRDSSPENLRPLLPVLPEQDSLVAWLELAGTLRRLATDLSSHQVTFAEVVEQTETEEERGRWKLLTSLFESYLSELRSAGLSDQLTDRLGVQERESVSPLRNIALIGTADLNESIAHVLSHHGGELVSLIAAPPERQAWFDSLGCLKPDAIAKHHLPVEDDHLITAAGMSDQALAVAEVLEDYSSRHSREQIVIGTTDESQVSPLEVELQLRGLSTYRHLGWTVASTAVGRLIDLTADLLNRPTWQSLAALVRHSDVHRWLQGRMEERLAKEKGRPRAKPPAAATATQAGVADANYPDLLENLDKLLATHFPVRLADPLPPQALKHCDAAHALREDLLTWLEPLLGPCFQSGRPIISSTGDAAAKTDSADADPADRFEMNSAALTSPRPLSQWCQAIGDWLASVYANPAEVIETSSGSKNAPGRTGADPQMMLWDEPADEPSDEGGSEVIATAEQGDAASADPDRLLTRRASNKVLELLERFSKLSEHLDLSVSAASAMETLSGRLADLRIGTDHEEGQIQISGWLDLAYDDGDAMVVTGLNHPYVPSAVTNDPFLPGSLRSKIRVADNERRLARDLYAMQVMISSRRDIRFIVGKTSADGSPTPPSRLLAAAEPADVARRMRQLLGRPRPATPLVDPWGNDLSASQLPIPKAHADHFPKSALSVTAFKAYLDCPFRFYLRHVLGLRPVDDASTELAANQFGDLVHGALEGFGLSSSRDETDPKQIFEALKHHLHEYAGMNYGERSGRAVRLQLHQAERRLQAVAEEQALRIASGWKIMMTEASVNESDGARVQVGNRSIGLRGRFDRVDQHEQTKQWAILDYKTHGHKPEKKHLKKVGDRMEWIDLQLPLYRKMIPQLGIKAPPDEVQLGYFNVGDKPEETRINIAQFSPEDLKRADEVIERCVRRILDCDFAPNPDGVQYDDYEMIMQTGVTTRMISADTEEGGPGE